MKNNSYYQKLLDQWNNLTQQPERDVALEDESLQYVARPTEQLDAPIEPEVSQEEIANADLAKSQMDDYFKQVGSGQVPMPGVGLGMETDQTNIQSAQDAKDLMPDERQIAGEIQNQMRTSSPEEVSMNAAQQNSEVKAPAEPSQYEKLMQEYLSAKDQSVKDINAGYEKDRKSQMIQGLITNLGKALTYSGYAGGDVMSGPQPIDIKPIDMKYAEQAKESNKNKLDTYKELMSQLKQNKADGLGSQIVYGDGGSSLVSWDKSTGKVISKVPVSESIATAKDKFIETGKTDRQGKSLAQGKEKLDFSKEKHEHEKTQKDEPSDKQKEQITGFDSAIDGIERLEGMETFFTGPVEGRIAQIKQRIGNNPEAQARAIAQLNMILSSYGKAISGTAIGDKEMENLRSQLPQVTADAEQFASVLKNFKDQMELSRGRLLDNIKLGGKNIDNYVTRRSMEDIKKEYVDNKDSNKNSKYTDSQEKAISLVMDNNEVDRETAIKALKKKYSGKF